MRFEIRPINDALLGAWRHSMLDTFGLDPAADPQGEERLRGLLDLSRAFGAFDGHAIVGTAACFDFDLSVPGGSLPMAGLTMVSVRPTHRRRGILRALMAAHLDAAREEGQPVSGLFASEATIYGRFGYGVAAECEVMTFSSAGTRVAEGHARDEVEHVVDDLAAALVPEVYARTFASRPGMYSRSADWWRLRRFSERPDQRAGTTPRKYAITRRGEVITGYIAYRQRLAWSEGVPAGSFEIDELVATDVRAEATLWHYLGNIDLYPKVTWWNAPVDSLLPWLLNDRRKVHRRRAETLWLRVDDLAAALAARTYAADGELRIAVDDEATHRLTSQADVARCVRSDEAPDLRLDRAALGSIYLGASSPSLLARAGRVHGSASALALADRMFAWPVAAWCPEIF